MQRIPVVRLMVRVKAVKTRDQKRLAKLMQKNYGLTDVYTPKFFMTDLHNDGVDIYLHILQGDKAEHSYDPNINLWGMPGEIIFFCHVTEEVGDWVTSEELEHMKTNLIKTVKSIVPSSIPWHDEIILSADHLVWLGR